ncbi:hypothetical protein Psuf_002360 [Phytohabitans suffuscus]|uniref:Uncharacterized protein n=1 Tax=Phytohabitans suffuscus TaxID=624315 RepID=A0A6F8YA74_9ACTN|nr:hypothetical protein Psuf_002360 [Phytohabitans suffuscus]
MVSAVVIAPAPATAAYDGWHAKWSFSDGHRWTFSINIGSATVAGSGYDDENIRYLSGTVTDASPQSHLCARVDFKEPAGVHGRYTACGGSVYFSHLDDSPSDYTFTLSIVATNSSTVDQSAHITVPGTATRPDLRASGVGAGWQFVDDDFYRFHIIRPHAVVLGRAMQVSNGPRWFEVNTYTSGCARTDLYEPSYDSAAPPWLHLRQDQVCEGVAEFGSYDFFRPVKVRSCLAATLMHPKGYLYTTWTHQCVSLETP